MKKLYLMRHAEASSNQIDKIRELTKFGISQAINVADHISKTNIEIDFILSSSSVRTKSTVEYILRRLEKNIHVKYLDLLYNPNLDIIYDLIKFTNDDHNSLLIVSHNPSISDLVYKISNEEHLVKPATIISFESTITSWRKISSSNFILKEVYYG